MPLLLDTPFNPGDLDPGESYPYIQITEIEVNLRPATSSMFEPSIQFVYEYGNLEDEDWVPGRVSPRPVVSLTGEDYNQMVVSGLAIADEDYRVYDAVKRLLYTWLTDNTTISGIIV